MLGTATRGDHAMDMARILSMPCSEGSPLLTIPGSSSRIVSIVISAIWH